MFKAIMYIGVGALTLLFFQNYTVISREKQTLYDEILKKSGEAEAD
jgi:hypothetical protein